MAISNAMAADGGSEAPATSAVQAQGTTPQAPPQGGDGDRGDCPGHDGEGRDGSGPTSETGYTMQ
jgi:hypothetical protein